MNKGTITHHIGQMEEWVWVRGREVTKNLSYQPTKNVIT